MEKLTLPVFGMDRHRLLTDGVGVTTLVGAYGCPLQCKYCLNPHARNPKTLEGCRHYTVGELYDILKVDNLYFQATGGGITFGGGESLLHVSFIEAFRKECERRLKEEIKEDYCWRITAETSLHVPETVLDLAILCIDDFIIDIKDMNPEIYQRYTGMDNEQVLHNLEKILAKKGTDALHIRVPRIPDYQDEEAVEKSVVKYRSLSVY